MPRPPHAQRNKFHLFLWGIAASSQFHGWIQKIKNHVFNESEKLLADVTQRFRNAVGEYDGCFVWNIMSKSTLPDFESRFPHFSRFIRHQASGETKTSDFWNDVPLVAFGPHVAPEHGVSSRLAGLAPHVKKHTKKSFCRTCTRT